MYFPGEVVGAGAAQWFLRGILEEVGCSVCVCLSCPLLTGLFHCPILIKCRREVGVLGVNVALVLLMCSRVAPKEETGSREVPKMMLWNLFHQPHRFRAEKQRLQALAGV